MIAKLNELLADNSMQENPLWQSLRYRLVNNECDVKGFAEYCLFYRNLSWINSQYCPFEMWSFEKDYLNDLNGLGTIENHCYLKKFVKGYDNDGNPIIEEKPYSKEFRQRLLDRRFDILTPFESDKLFELMFDLYAFVDIDKRKEREDKAQKKSDADALAHLSRLYDEKVVTR